MTNHVHIYLAAFFAALLVFAGVWFLQSDRFAGITHLTGLEVGEDGLTIADGGAVDLGSGDVDLGTADLVIDNVSVDIATSTFEINGVEYYTANASFNSASTTACSVPAHTTASSTLVAAISSMTISTTTAWTGTWAKDDGTAGSSTPFENISVSAGAQAYLAPAATTTSAGMANYTFAPGYYLNLTMAGGATAGTYSPSGAGCSGLWMLHR